jgi:hypothetical protein
MYNALSVSITASQADERTGPWTTGVIFGNRGPGKTGHFFNVTKQNG